MTTIEKNVKGKKTKGRGGEIGLIRCPSISFFFFFYLPSYTYTDFSMYEIGKKRTLMTENRALTRRLSIGTGVYMSKVLLIRKNHQAQERRKKTRTFVYKYIYSKM
jgi:hypothetical protein